MTEPGMAMTARTGDRTGLLAIHLAVALFGLAGLFAKFLALPALVVVFGRTCFATLAFGVIFGCKPRLAGPFSVAVVKGLVLMGAVLAAHWWTFFHAIQISSVAVGLLSFATFPVFITFMEPLVFKERLTGLDLATAFGVVAGLAMVAWPSDADGPIIAGALWGTASGALFAVLSIANRVYVQRHSALMIAGVQNAVAAALLAPLIWLYPARVTGADVAWLAVLGLGCTAVAHALFIHGMRRVRAQLAGVLAALEPAYGILFAYVLLGEVPAVMTLIGGSVILGTTVAAVLWRKPVGTAARS